MGAVAACVLGVVLLMFGVLIFKDTPAPYDVEFGAEGGTCTGSGGPIVIDVRTGDTLYCGHERSGKNAPFTPEEKARLATTVQALAHGDGLSHDDRDQIEKLVRSMGAAHGDAVRSRKLQNIYFAVSGLLALGGGGIAWLIGRRWR